MKTLLLSAMSRRSILQILCGLCLTAATPALAASGGTASSNHLDIRKYATIDDAGWNSANVNHLYQFKYESDGVAWLTMSTGGASTNYTDTRQNWYAFADGARYTASSGWTSTAPLLGSSAYFVDIAPAIYGKSDGAYTVTFYVTGCSAVKTRMRNLSTVSSDNPPSLNVYECSVSETGELIASSNPSASASNGNTSVWYTLSVSNLDMAKIYKVEVSAHNSYFYEIGFQTIIERGTAASQYLDLAKYATIDAAGWDATKVDNLYQYTEYESDGGAWLTLATGGAAFGITDCEQNWYAFADGTRYSASSGWNPSAPLLGSSAYFVDIAPTMYGKSDGAYTATFYVTGCSAIKTRMGNLTLSSDYPPPSLNVYECSVSETGELTASSDLSASNSYGNNSVIYTLSVSNLDMAKIYKVEVSAHNSYFYEIGFQSIEKGTAASQYLDLAKYVTIDGAGWSSSYVDNLYQYNEYINDNIACLTIPFYGAYSADSRHNWFSCNVATLVNTSWSAQSNHFLLGSSVYFTNATSRAFGTPNARDDEQSATFYVTNCSAVSAYVRNNSHINEQFPTYLRVYECSETESGELSVSDNPYKNIISTTEGGRLLSVTGLNTEKIYKIVVGGARAYFYEIGFRTPLPRQVKTLAELISAGQDDTEYYVYNDNLTAVECSVDADGIATIYAKDNNGYATPDVNSEGYIDYMNIANFGSASEYDQSNWVAITLPGTYTTDDQIAELSDFLGRKLSDVVGTWSKDSYGNSKLVALRTPKAGAVDAYTKNTYITSSFLGKNQTAADGKNYFFVTPKPMEVANITWAQWNETKNAFVVPAHQNGVNAGGLDGGFTADFSLIDGFNPSNGETYNFIGLIKKTSSQSPPANKAAGGDNATVSNEYVVFPLSLVGQDGVITGLTDIKQPMAEDDTFYNLLGIPVKNPGPGIYVHRGRKVVIR